MGSKAAVILAFAASIGLADAFVLRKKNLELAAPKPASTATDTSSEHPHAPLGDSSQSPAKPDPAHADAQLAATSPSGVKQPDAAPVLDANMIGLARAVELFNRMMTAGDVRFVDARNQEDFDAAHIPAAVCIPPTKFGGVIPPEVEQLSRDATIVVYCGGGECDASKLTALRLNELGFTNTLIFHDGFPAWEKAGQPVEK